MQAAREESQNAAIQTKLGDLAASVLSSHSREALVPLPSSRVKAPIGRTIAREHAITGVEKGPWVAAIPPTQHRCRRCDLRRSGNAYRR